MPPPNVVLADEPAPSCPCPLSVSPPRYIRFLVQTTQNNNRNQQSKRAVDVGEEEERGKRGTFNSNSNSNNNNNTSGDSVGPSGSVVGGARRRSSGNGGPAGGGHQKRHQEWLDKFGEVSRRKNICLGSDNCKQTRGPATRQPLVLKVFVCVWDCFLALRAPWRFPTRAVHDDSKTKQMRSPDNFFQCAVYFVRPSNLNVLL